MEQIVEERSLPTYLYAQLLRSRTQMRQLASKHGDAVEEALDVFVEPGERPRSWKLVFLGVADDGNRFRVELPVRRRGRSRWLMDQPRLFVNDVENEEFEGSLEEALAAALGGSGGRPLDTQGAPAGSSRGTRSNAVETRRATVIRV